MNNMETLFGVNFIDGRIKGYPNYNPRTREDDSRYFRLVRGEEGYGENNFVDNGDGTITDLATGLMWQMADDGTSRDWEDALAYSENLNLAGYDDWRLPNAKELQSIVDYTRGPQTTDSPAIDPLFDLTEITDPTGHDNYGFYWTSTSHKDGKNYASNASYVAFGEALGQMNGQVMDVHGAGAVRSDPKSGDISDYPKYHGPQGDVQYLNNYVLSVRDADIEVITSSSEIPAMGVSDEFDYDYGGMLFAPMQSTTTYLIDQDENIVKTWESDYRPGLAAYMLPDGSLLRTGTVNQNNFDAGGKGGIVEWIGSDDEVLWSYEYATDTGLLHHDIEPLPNGNILMISWEKMTESQAIALGRNPDLLADNELWMDRIIEVDPTKSENNIVWQWCSWEHLVQDYDTGIDNYGSISSNPGRIDINYTPSKGPGAKGADWSHINSIDYNEVLDQIVVSVHTFNEVWVIDHNTTTKEAAGEKGDLLYRFGNPMAYDKGTRSDQILFGQHDADWLITDSGWNILLYNNGIGRGPIDSSYSTVDEYRLPLISMETYEIDGGMFEEANLVWQYTAEEATDMFSASISGVDRLDNGNTLICTGESGDIREVTGSGDIVRTYTNPYGDSRSGGPVSPVFKVEGY